MNDQFVLLLSFPGRPSAEMAASVLNDAGIATLIKDHAETGMFSEISPAGLLSVELHVPISCKDEAKALLSPLLG